MSIKEHIKENMWEIGSFIILSILPFLLYENLILKVFVFILTIVFSASIYYLSYQVELKSIKFLVSLKFFSSYLLKINDGNSLKISYESSIKPLITFYDIVSFEKIMENINCPYDLKKFKTFFIYTLEKEKKNEAQLPNYIPLQEDIDETIDSITKKKTKAKREKIFSLVLVLFIVLLVILTKSFSPSLFSKITNSNLKYIFMFLEILIVPTIEYIYISNIERANKNV